MKEKILCLCTCTSIEIMTTIGVISYLIYLGEPILALISGVVFAKLIIFHFVMEHYDRKTKLEGKIDNTDRLLIKKRQIRDMQRKREQGLDLSIVSNLVEIREKDT